MNSLSWRLIRMGDDGNPVLIQSYATQQEAQQQMTLLEGRGHKQTYWVEEAADKQVQTDAD
jgi:hypothetical protein